jgi:hypothetical protein
LGEITGILPVKTIFSPLQIVDKEAEIELLLTSAGQSAGSYKKTVEFSSAKQ